MSQSDPQRKRGRPPLHVAQSQSSRAAPPPYEKRRPRGGSASDAIAKARRAVRLSALSGAASAATPPEQVRKWPFHRALETFERESAELRAAASGGDMVGVGDGLIVSLSEALHLARFRVLLRTMYDFDDFRGVQTEALLEVGVRRKDAFVVWRTGGGKSMLYSLPALERDTLTVVIMPLIALIDDQLQRLTERKINAVALHGQMKTEDVDASMRRLWSAPEAVKLMLLSAEKAVFNGQVRTVLRQLVQAGRRLRFAIDEAHCVIEWGEFRPAYSHLSLLKAEFPDAPMLALTATATPEEAFSIAAGLGMQSPVFIRGCTDRPEVTYAVNPARAAYINRAMSELLHLLQGAHSGQSGIVYVASAKSVARVTDALLRAGVRAAGYHGQLPPSERPEVLKAWCKGTIDVVVATSAFGMGIDMPTCSFVVHLQSPSSFMSLQQQQGRVSRDGRQGHVYLLTAPSDERLWGWIFSHSAREHIQTERRKLGLVELDSKGLQLEVTRRTSHAHGKLREVSLYAKTTVCRRWALSVGMLQVVTNASARQLCESGSKCDNCSASHSRGKVVDVTAHADLMIAIVQELPGRTQDDLIAVFGHSQSKQLSKSLAEAHTYSVEHPLRAMLPSRPTRVIGEFVLDVLVVRGVVAMNVVVPEFAEPDEDIDDDPDVQGAVTAPRPQRVTCSITYAIASTNVQAAPRTFLHIK